MSKKGFTLVELLAVIAILAILVIMALPAVLRMYRQARIDTFQNEVRKLYTSAQQQFIADSMNISTGVTYGNNAAENTTCAHSLEMTGNDKFKYSIAFDVSGKVTRFVATNGTYNYDSGTVTDLQVSAINIDSSTAETAVTVPACATE